MSGVVNKSVADKAVSVKADELIRKPFQPQELIGRVKTLLAPRMRNLRDHGTQQLPGAAKFICTAACPGGDAAVYRINTRGAAQRSSVIPG